MTTCVKNVLVTGAAGFAGSIVVRCLKDAGFNVMGTVHRYEADGTFPTVHCDLSQPWTFDGAFDAVVHTAGALPYRHPSMLAYKKSNIDTMEHLVAFAKAHGVRRVIYFSTIGIYGDFRGNPAVDEDSHRIQPDAYGVTKYVAEELLRESGLETMSLRMPGLIGVGARPVWFTNTVEKFRRGEPVTIYAPDYETRNFVWAEDVARFIAKLLQLPHWDGDRLVLASRERVTIRALVTEMKQLARSTSEIRVAEGERPPFCLNPARALAMGYDPLSPLDIVRRYMEH